MALFDAALASAEKRSRHCYHPSISEPLQAMEICLLPEGRVAPHVHDEHRREFYYILDGEAEFIWFDKKEPKITGSVSLSSQPGNCGFYNLHAELPHTFLIFSRSLSFIECSNGPFTGTPAMAVWYESFSQDKKNDFWRSVEAYARSKYNDSR